MTNAETISKLNNALNTLIKAYEELEAKNTNLENRITELEDEVLELETVKEDLELNVNDFKTNTEEDNSNISSMLGKIEGLLNKKVSDDMTQNHSSSSIIDEIETAEETPENKEENETIYKL